MALSTPEQVQLFGKDNAPAGSGGFKLTGAAKDGEGLCRVWLRPLEAWDRALNPRMESDRWDVRAYQKLDSAFEFVPEFTLKDLEQMAENFDFPQDIDVFGTIEFNGDPVHDTVLAWARHVTGSSNEESSEGFTVREPQGRYATAKGTESLDINRELVFSSSSPAPLGGVTHHRPAPIPVSAKKPVPAKKTAPETRVGEPAAKQAPQKQSHGSEAARTTPKATPASSPKPPTPPPAKSAESPKAEPAAASKPPSPPPAPAKKPGSSKTTQAMSILSDEDFEDDKLSALRARLSKSRSSSSED